MAGLGRTIPGVLHYTVNGVTETDFGTREFATVDLDNNLISFFRWENRG